MTMSEHPLRAALALAAVDAQRQGEIIAAVLKRMDRPAAIRRRDRAIREAFALIGSAPGSVRVLAQALSDFSTRVWTCQRHLPEPPAHATPLHAALWRACQAADDAGARLPNERQVRRIVS